MSMHNLEAFADRNSLSWQLHQQTRAIITQHEEVKRWQQLEDRVVDRVLRRIQVEVRDEASPAIKAIRKEIDNMFRG